MSRVTLRGFRDPPDNEIDLVHEGCGGELVPFRVPVLRLEDFPRGVRMEEVATAPVGALEAAHVRSPRGYLRLGWS